MMNLVAKRRTFPLSESYKKEGTESDGSYYSLQTSSTLTNDRLGWHIKNVTKQGSLADGPDPVGVCECMWGETKVKQETLCTKRIQQASPGFCPRFFWLTIASKVLRKEGKNDSRTSMQICALERTMDNENCSVNLFTLLANTHPGKKTDLRGETWSTLGWKSD